MYLLATAALVAWIVVWLIVAYRVVMRDDLGVAAKVVWIILILVFPDRRTVRLFPLGRRETEHHVERRAPEGQTMSGRAA